MLAVADDPLQCYMKQSCWNGLLAGGLLSVDNFTNAGAAAFLLTHTHTDHMVGLEHGWCRGPLYTTEQNRAFVLQRFRIDAALLHVVPFYDESLLSIGVNRDQLKGNCTRVTNPHFLTVVHAVVALPANHCPGSAMFYVEDRHGERALATGDFRFCEAMLREPLLRCVDTLYLDTTFLHPQFASFPTKDHSVKLGEELHVCV